MAPLGRYKKPNKPKLKQTKPTQHSPATRVMAKIKKIKSAIPKVQYKTLRQNVIEGTKKKRGKK